MFTKMMFATVAAAVLTSSAFADWTIHKPDGGRCKIAFPIEPKTNTTPGDPNNGRGELTAVTADDATTGLSWALMWDDFHGAAGEAFKSASAEQRQLSLSGARDGWVKVAGGKLQSERKMKLGDHSGVEFVLSLADGKLMKIQLFIVNDRLYQLGVQGKAEAIQGGEADEFFKSFRLLRSK